MLRNREMGEQFLVRQWLSLNEDITFKKIGCTKITELNKSGKIFVRGEMQLGISCKGNRSSREKC
jgi:hypothetical protein